MGRHRADNASQQQQALACPSVLLVRIDAFHESHCAARSRTTCIQLLPTAPALNTLHALETCMIVPCARWETRDPQRAANFWDDKGTACSDGDWHDDSDDEGEADALNAEARRITKTHPHPNPRARVRARA